jgi:osmotically-inducible protein OsmY
MITRSFPKPFYLVGLIVAVVLTGGPLLSAGQDKNSEDLKSRIDEKFKQQGLLVGNAIQVTIEAKTVILSGSVRTLAVKEQAGRDAQSVAEGHKIANNLALVNPGLSPQQIAEGVMAAIDESPAYFIFDYVEVGVTIEGVVTLEGWTSSGNATEFVKLAKSQSGVTKVESRIKRVLSMGSDRDLRDQVAQRIYAPIVSGFSRMKGRIHILVDNGVVTLGGTVDKESDINDLAALIRSGHPLVVKLRVKKK